MCGNHPQGKLSGGQISKDRSSRLQAGQLETTCLPHVDAVANQHDIAMPAEAWLIVVKRGEPKAGAFVNLGRVENRPSLVETIIGFLQRDDVSVQRRDQIEDTFRVPSCIATDRLADVIAGNPDPHRNLVALRPRRPPDM